MALTKNNTKVTNIQELADIVVDQATTVKALFDKSNTDIKTYINDTLTVELDALDAANVKKIGDQIIVGIKTFSSSPIVPTPTTDMQVANKAYVLSQSPLSIANGSITDLKLSNAEGDIKNRLSTYMAETAKKTVYTPVPDAATSPTATISAGGSVDTGTHNYIVTFVTADGETGFTALAPTPTTAVTTAGNNTVNLASIPLGATGTTARKIYRMSSLLPLRYYVLLATIANNTATTYTDAAADASLPTTGMQSKWNTTAGKLFVGDTMAGYIGESNTLLGMRGLELLTTGFDNTGMGMGVFSAMTSGYNNSAFGVNALLANTSGLNNTALGVHALQNSVSGSSNTAIGVYTLEFNVTGEANVAIGVGSMLDNSSGSKNTAVGVNSLANNTIGIENVAIGMGALETNSIGLDNVAVGYNALHANTASGNTAIGYNALLNNTSGDNNVAIGLNSLQVNTTGYNNLALGSNSLKVSATGFNNTALGANSLLANIGGYNNSAIGLSALQSNISGSANTAIGINSLLLATNSNNTAVGFSSGSTVTTGTDNTLIGNNADVITATFYRATAIGSGAKVAASDTMQLGDVNLTNVSSHGDFEAQDIGDGFVCKSPNGTRHRITVSDANAIVVTLL